MTSLVMSGGKIISASGGLLSSGVVGNLLGINFDANGGASLSASGLPIFQDKVREARGFTNATTFNNPVTIDSNGWPTQDFLCLLAEGATTPSWGTSGTFKCGFTGTGTVASFGGCSLANIVTGGSTTFDLNPTGLPFGFTVTSTSGTISNIFAHMPGYPGSGYSSSSSFTTEAINHYKQYSYLRVMDGINVLFNTVSMTSTTRNTASNTKTNKSGATSNTADGYPMTWFVDFVNACGIGLWGNATLNYDSSFLTSLATDMAGVTPGRPAYIEPGNEVWNFPGIGGQYSAKVTAYKNANPGVIDYDGTSDTLTLYARYYAVWIHDIATNFQTVFGSRYGTDLKVVAAWQTGGNGVFFFDAFLKFLVHQYGSISPYVHCLAVAPYKTRDNTHVPGDTVNHTNVNDTIANIQSQLTANANYISYLSNLENIAVLAMHNGLQMVTYEGGWEIGGETTSVTNLGASIMDSGMTSVVNGYLANQISSGLKEFTWLAAGVDTSSNALSPGYKLSNNYSTLIASGCPRTSGFANAEANTITLNRNVVSASGSSFSAKNCADYGWNGTTLQFISTNPTLAGSATNFTPFYGITGYVPYIVNCTVAGTYTLVLNATGSATSDVWCNGVKVATSVSIPSGTNNTSMATLTLKKGPDNYVLLGNGTNQSGCTLNTLTFN